MVNIEVKKQNVHTYASKTQDMLIQSTKSFKYKQKFIAEVLQWIKFFIISRLFIKFEREKFKPLWRVTVIYIKNATVSHG